MASRYTAADLAAACGLTEMEAAECIQQFDEEGDGTLAAQDFEDLRDQIMQQQAADDDMTNKINANDNLASMDADGDGRLSAEELAAACNITPMEAQNIIMQYDADGDGTLNADEFEDLKQQILAQQREHMTDKISHNDFHDAMDADGDGQLTATELAAACNISELEAQNIITQYDANGDGVLNAEEFEDLKQQILKQQREKMAEQMSEDTNFQQMDDNKDSKLSAKELAAACNITELQAQNVIQQYDVNNDGYLNEEEFETLKQQILKEQAAKLQQERQQRQAEQDAQYKANTGNKSDDKVQEFKHKWKFGMNFDPKNENVVVYVSDEVTQKNWGITLKKNDFNGPIRQEYRKLGGVVSSGTIKYDYPQYGGPLQVHITGKNGETYNYSCPEQL